MTGVRKMFYLDMSNAPQDAYLNDYYAAAPENSHYYSNDHFYLQ